MELNIINLFNAMPGACAQGLIWGIMAIGVYITYKILDLADLTVDGTMCTGGAVCVVMILNGFPVWISLLFAFLAGVIAGLVTGLLHTAMGIPAILAGILTQLGLYSINLRIMGGKANNPLLKADTVVSFFADNFSLSNSMASMAVGILLVILVILILYWFFGTEIGSALRATGDNEDMIRALGVNTGHAKLLALAISNALVGLSGAMIAQMQKYADINMGRGAIVIGLAAIVIGEVLLGRLVKNFGFKLFSAVLGSIVYFIIQALVLRFGIDPNDMKLLSAITVAAALAIPVAMDRYNQKKSYSEDDLYADEHRRRAAAKESTGGDRK